MALRDFGFYAGDDVIREALAAVGETWGVEPE
jgi:hypothetical protein